jgi:hypothetical protein
VAFDGLVCVDVDLHKSLLVVHQVPAPTMGLPTRRTATTTVVQRASGFILHLSPE